MKTYDFVAIGDVVTDEFIRLKDAHVTCRIDNEQCELCMRFADKIPYESVETVHAVGNAANAAVSATRLGLSTAFVGDVGGDELGEKILETMSFQGVSTEFVNIHKEMVSNHHYVLQYGAERTILVKHQPYERTLPEDIGEPSWIYLSSLGDNSLPFHQTLSTYLTTHPSTKLAFQPGTFQIKLSAELKNIYAQTYIFFCNKEEAKNILKAETIDIKDVLVKIADLGPKIVVITDGPKGAHAYDSKTKEMWTVPMYPDPKDPVDRTGAGDSFASTVVSALALGKPLSEALLWGPINSMSVVQEIGAQKGLLSQEKLLGFLEEAPADYKVTKFG